MRILHISDTHGEHHQLSDMPGADVIVHSGDISFAGSEDEAIDFIQWFSSLPYTSKVFIAGNHDNCLHGANIEDLPNNCFYLSNSSVVIGGFTFHGVPLFMEDIVSGDYDESLKKIPDHTDVLITHQPPYGVLDFSGNSYYGDRDLLQTVLDIRPRCHLFGHIHDAYGMENGKDTLFANASIVDVYYRLLNKPFLFEI